MTNNRLNNDLYRTLVLTILAGLAVIIVGLANRDVFAKDEVIARDAAIMQRLEAHECLGDDRYQTIIRGQSEIREDVKWLTRQMGGELRVETREGGDSPQRD